MKYKCEKCHDTGSRDKSAEYPDCVYCQAAMQRVALMDWLLLECRHQTLAQSAWAIHQRALSIAADHFNDVVKMVPAAAPQVASINIKDFGADPSGKNDSTAAVQAAIDHASKISAPQVVADERAALARLLRESIEVINSIPNDYSLDLVSRINVALEAAPVQAQEPVAETYAHTMSNGRGRPDDPAPFETVCVRLLRNDLPADLKLYAAPVQAQEPVLLQWRWRDTHPNTVTTGQFSEWETCDKTKYDEIVYYRDNGYPHYEVRKLFTHSAAVRPVPDDWTLMPNKLTQKMVSVLEFGRNQPAHNTYLNLRTAAPSAPVQPVAVPEAAQQNGGLVRAALIDLLSPAVERAANSGAVSFECQSNIAAIFARGRQALAQSAFDAAPAAQGDSKELTDAEILNAVRDHFMDGDGGYMVDTAPKCVIAGVRAAIAAKAAS